MSDVSESRLGRPKSANARETRQRILEAARRLFAAHGYEGASNRSIAEEANLTTGAIYHYFDRKLDIYLAVYTDTQTHIDQRMEQAIAECDTLIDGIRAFLETAHDLNNEDPSLAMFMHSCGVDAQRDPDLAASLARTRQKRGRGTYKDLIDLGIKTGELDHADADKFRILFRTITVGLVDEASGNRRKHRAAVDAVLQLLEGKLLRPPAGV